MRQSRFLTVGVQYKPRERFSIQFLLRTQRNAEQGSILVTVSHRNQRLKFALGQHHIYLWEWDAVRQRMISGLPRSKEVNAEVDRTIEVIFFYFTRTEAHSPQPSINGLRQHLFPQQTNRSSETPYTFQPLFNRFLREHTNGGRPLSSNTLKNYKVVLNSWKGFERELGRTLLINDFSSATHQQTVSGRKLIESYARFLTDKGINGSPCTDNTIRRYLKVTSTFFRWYEKEHGITLLRDFNIGGEVISRYTVSLTVDEVTSLENAELKIGSKLHHVRNMMLLAISTGLRHSEWLLIKPQMWREPSQLIVSPKTGKSCLVVHRERVRQILREYEVTGFLQSMRNNQKVNTQIKDVARLCGLNRNVIRVRTIDGVDYHESLPLHEVISTHTFRRTKITMDLNAGRSLRDICLETGQDEIIAKRHYDRPNFDEHVRNLGVDKIE